jgi:hypothetical protein
MDTFARRGFLQTSLAAGAVLGLGETEPTASSPSTPTPVDVANPRVQPGRVRWHRDFAAACAVSQRSNKPVFLLQMMGRLDEQFC